MKITKIQLLKSQKFFHLNNSSCRAIVNKYEICNLRLEITVKIATPDRGVIPGVYFKAKLRFSASFSSVCVEDFRALERAPFRNNGVNVSQAPSELEIWQQKHTYQQQTEPETTKTNVSQQQQTEPVTPWIPENRILYFGAAVDRQILGHLFTFSNIISLTIWLWDIFLPFQTTYRWESERSRRSPSADSAWGFSDDPSGGAQQRNSSTASHSLTRSCNTQVTVIK